MNRQSSSRASSRIVAAGGIVCAGIVVSGGTLDDGVPGTANSTQVMAFKPVSPNAAPLNSIGFSTGTAGTTLDLTLPETGNYAITISPSGLDSGALNLGVTHQ